MNLKRYSPLLLLPLALSIFFLVYSYFWIDHGVLTFITSDKPSLGIFFQMIEYTNNNKVLMAQSFLLLVILLFICQIIFFIPRVYRSLSLKSTFIVLGTVSLLFALAYAFLSRDIYYYYITAKMAYYYHLNPFYNTPNILVDKDFFVSISHNTGSPYLYGPLFLLFSIIPMAIFTTQKIILYFLIFKILNGTLFFLSGLLLFKIIEYDRRFFAIWFLNPFLLIEWLANSHNDNVMIFAVFIGMYFLHKKQVIKSLFFIVCSFLIKRASLVTLPLFILNEKWRIHYFKITGITLPFLIHIYGGITGVTIEPWYLSWSYMLLPFAKLKSISWIAFFVIGFISLLNYYRFLESSGWGAGPIIPYQLFITTILLVTILLIEYRLPQVISIRILRLKR